MVGPQGKVMVSHLCGHVEDLKALALHIVVEWWWGRFVSAKRK